MHAGQHVRTLLLGLPTALGCQASHVEPRPPTERPDVASGDAGVEVDVVPLPEPEPPAPPAPPGLPWVEEEACPDGWHRVVQHAGEASAYAYCEPPALGDCPAGQMQRLGEAACRPLGTVCPDGDWADEATLRGLAPGFGGDVVYVRAGAELGDGSRARPVGSIEEAITRFSTSGAIVALARGAYQEAVFLDPPVAIVGACVAETVLAGEGTLWASVVEAAEGGGGRLSNLTVAGGTFGVLVEGATEPVVLSDVEVTGASLAGVFASHSEVSLARVVVREVCANEGNRTCDGVAIGSATAAVFEQVVVDRCRGGGLLVAADAEVSTVALADVVVRGTRLPSEADLVRALSISGAVRLTGRRLLIDGSDTHGLSVSEDMLDPLLVPVVDLSDVFIRDIRARGDLTIHSAGVSALGGSRVTLDRAVVVDAAHTGVYVAGGPSELTASDLVVRGVSRTPDAFSGAALRAYSGARVTVTRGAFDRSDDAGISVRGDLPRPPTRLALSDVLLQEAWGAGGLVDGVGLDAFGAVEVTVERALLLRHSGRGVGVWSDVDGHPATVTLTDVSVGESGLAGPSAGQGVGLVLVYGAQVRLERVQVTDSRQAGIFVAHSSPERPTVVEGSDVTIADTAGLDGQGADGYGLVVQGEARLRLARLAVEDSTTVGVYALGVVGGAAPEVHLESASIRGTRRAPCGEVPEGREGSCVEGGRDQSGGVGVAVSRGGRLDLSSFDVRDNAGAGVLVASGGLVTARRGVVTANAVGLAFLDPGLAELEDAVYSFANSIDASTDGVEPKAPDVGALLRPLGEPAHP